MEKDPDIVARLAAHREDENWHFRTFLRVLSPRKRRQVDRLAEAIAHGAALQMDCRTCGACCRDNAIPLDDSEVARLASRLGVSVDAFRRQYLADDPEDGPIIDARPCPFLAGNCCSVYEDRPEACRGYPYVGGGIVLGMVGVIERAGTCPIIFDMLERLKDAVGFRRYHERESSEHPGRAVTGPPSP
jgi:uncharacterized protein